MSDEDDDNSQNDNDNIDLDELLPLIGEFGAYQKLLIWLVCLPACIPCGFGAFNQLFMSYTPDHWCSVPAMAHLNLQERVRLAIPFEEGKGRSKCHRYAVDWLNLNESNAEEMDVSKWPIESCKDGWEYNETQVQSSIVIDFDLVCDRDIYPTIGLAALNVGGPIGVYMFGLMSDRFGRKKSFFVCLTTLIAGNALTALAANFWQWAGSRIVVGLTIPAVYQIPFIISLEMVGPNYRSFVTVMTCMFYTCGLILLSFVSYFVRNWVHLAYCSSIPFTVYYISGWFLPESPRWLLAKGRFYEAQKILQTLARINGTVIPRQFDQKFKKRLLIRQSSAEKRKLEKGPGVLALCKTPNMRLKTILIIFNWFANDMVYVGLSYYGPSLGSNEYVSFFLSSVVEIPSCLLCWFAMDKWGRRWPLSVCMLLSGFSCIVTVMLPEDAVLTTLVLFLFSKFAICASFLIIYPFAGELYPTQLRGIGIGVSAYIAGIGLIVIPFITYLGRENLVLPLAIMGVISIVGGVVALRLPETLHHNLPQTVEEGEEFGKDWSYADCFSCPKKIIKSDSLHNSFDEDWVEMSPLNNAAGPKERKPCLRKMKSMPLDSDGLFKMTYWV